MVYQTGPVFFPDQASTRKDFYGPKRLGTAISFLMGTVYSMYNII